MSLINEDLGIGFWFKHQKKKKKEEKYRVNKYVHKRISKHETSCKLVYQHVAIGFALEYSCIPKKSNALMEKVKESAYESIVFLKIVLIEMWMEKGRQQSQCQLLKSWAKETFKVR